MGKTSLLELNGVDMSYCSAKEAIINELEELKVGAGFRLLASRSPCVPGRLELSLTMLPLGSSDSAFSLQSAPIVHVAIARWKHVDTFLPTAAGLPLSLD